MNPGKKQPKAKLPKHDEHIAALEQEVAKFRDLAARAQADLQNAKDRMQKEGVEMRKYALENTLLALLPTVDNFQRAFAHLPADLKDHAGACPELVEWVKGVSAIEQELLRHLEGMGLKKMDCVGQPVDPAKHEVLQAGPGAKDTVIAVFEDGYELNGRVLRPAKVKVGYGS